MDTSLEIRPLRREDNAAVREVIRRVMTEHGAIGPGFAIHDPEVQDMVSQYSKMGSAYYVVVDKKDNGRVLGGAGFGPLQGAEKSVCELRKMYFLPELRGRGAGKQLLELCLEAAKNRGYQKCYLETLESMSKARRMYEKAGFKKRCAPLGSTGHFGCDSWYDIDL